MSEMLHDNPSRCGQVNFLLLSIEVYLSRSIPKDVNKLLAKGGKIIAATKLRFSRRVGATNEEDDKTTVI